MFKWYQASSCPIIAICMLFLDLFLPQSGARNQKVKAAKLGVPSWKVFLLKMKIRSKSGQFSVCTFCGNYFLVQSALCGGAAVAWIYTVEFLELLYQHNGGLLYKFCTNAIEILDIIIQAFCSILRASSGFEDIFNS